MRLMLCMMAIFAMGSAYGFGISGDDGRNGQSGRDGKNGKDITIHADGNAHTFDLNGESAYSNGMSGEHGENASSCYHNQGQSNEYGADGGDGGNGGDGGDGGRGGDILVYYKNLKELKQLTIFAEGGHGTSAGYKGYGGNGCSCSTSSWTIESCWTDQVCRTVERCRDVPGGTRPDGSHRPGRRVCRDVKECSDVRKCEDKTYYCRDGSDGSDGSDGRDGSKGRYGHISLVKGIDQLPNQSPKKEGPISAFLKSEVLSKQIWEGRSGAKDLFSASSNVRNDYSHYIRLAQKSFKLVWNNEREISEFENNHLVLSFNGETIAHQIKGEDFFELEPKEENGETVVYINKAYKKSEFTQLKVKGATGYGDNLEITIDDSATMSQVVKNQVSLQFVYKKWFQWWVVYDEVVPAEALTITDDKIVIHVGKLGLPFQAIKRKRKVRFTVNVKRSFGNNSADVEEFFGPIKLY